MKSEKATQVFLLAAGMVFFLVGIFRGEAAEDSDKEKYQTGCK